jgi:hypothetical protein
MAVIGMAAFAIFVSQSASFLDFQRQRSNGHARSNWETLFQMARIPSTTTSAPA